VYGTGQWRTAMATAVAMMNSRMKTDSVFIRKWNNGIVE
jgi:hypothetical protein